MKTFFWCYLLTLATARKAVQEFSNVELALIISVSEAMKCNNSTENNLPYMALSPARTIQMAAVLHKLIGSERCKTQVIEDKFNVNNPNTWQHCSLGKCENSTCSCDAFIVGEMCQIFIGRCWLLYCTLKYCEVPYLDEKLVCHCSNGHDQPVAGGIYFYDEGIQSSYASPKTRIKHQNFAYYVFESSLYKKAVDEVSRLYGGRRTLMYLMKRPKHQSALLETMSVRRSLDQKLPTSHRGDHFTSNGKPLHLGPEKRKISTREEYDKGEDSEIPKFPRIKVHIGRIMDVTGMPTMPENSGEERFKFPPVVTSSTKSISTTEGGMDRFGGVGGDEGEKYEGFPKDRKFGEMAKTEDDELESFKTGIDTSEYDGKFQKNEEDMGGFQTIPPDLSRTEINEPFTEGFPFGTEYRYKEQQSNVTPCASTKHLETVANVPTNAFPTMIHNFHKQPENNKIERFGSSDLSAVNEDLSEGINYSNEAVKEYNADEESQRENDEGNDISVGVYKSDEQDYEEYDDDRGCRRCLSSIITVLVSILLLRL